MRAAFSARSIPLSEISHMKRILPLAGAFVLMAGAITQAQDTQTPATQPSRLDRLEQRVNQMESDLESKDAEIEQLKSQLATRPAATEAQPPVTQPPTTQSSTDSALSDIDKTTQDIMKDISSK